MRKTKIICTIGPVTSSFDMLSAMAEAGMDVVRLNMSHGDHESHSKIIKSIKTLNQKIKYPIPLLLDTQGPEIRTGNLKENIELKDGDVVTVAARNVKVEESSIPINYDDIVDAVAIDDIITVDNGLINLQVLSKKDKTMKCKVIDGGTLKSRRHVNLPGIHVNLPAITKKDKEDIEFGIAQEVDFIALSFVRQASDVRELKALLGDKKDKIKIIAKIEDQEGVRNIDQILNEVDGVMVARGDLGVEIRVEELPNVQRLLVRKCHERGKRCIVATHLLESMIQNPIPTRAEVTDVANTIYEEVDAIMLSGETTVGKYPIKCIEYLDKIAQTSEKEESLNLSKNLVKETDKQHLAHSAVELAESLGAVGIVVITRRGLMANYVTNCRPFKTPIYAFTNDSRTRRVLALNRNVIANRLTFSSEPEKTLHNAFLALKAREGLESGDKVVVISDVIADTGVDAIQIRSL
ncbi:pyruvate kinase [Gammaproteobacteria bacterium 42_54_T18]|mgnify:CR=1 FL=1|nr:pyruvate kinase [Gammaproteobacteria bacterium 42_54_T18]